MVFDDTPSADAGPRFVGAARLRALLPMGVAVDALEAALVAGAPLTAPARTSLPAGAGEVLLMPAAGAAGAGIKLVSVHAGNPARGLPLVQGVYVLFDAETLAPRAILEGAELTRIRTAAVSALAARHLARPDPAALVVFGAGVQAAAHVEALRAVRPVARVTVVGRSAGAVERLVAALAADGVEARAGDADAVAHADLVCTCTTATEPVFDGALLPAGAHVTAVGTHRPDARELDETTLRRGRVVVEERDRVLAEAGELAIPLAAGTLAPEAVVADLREVVAGASVRRTPQEITIFKSVGVGWEDLVVAAAALDRLAP